MSKRLSEIRERCYGATPGPWKHDAIALRDVSTKVYYNHFSGQGDIARVRSTPSFVGNLLFISHARDDIPWLLGEIDRLQGEVYAKDAEIIKLKGGE